MKTWYDELIFKGDRITKVKVNDGQTFEGTIEQFDNCFGISISCSLDDVLAYCAFKGWKLTCEHNKSMEQTCIQCERTVNDCRRNSSILKGKLELRIP